MNLSYIFLDQSSAIYSDAVTEDVTKALDLIEAMPTIGSKIIPQSIKEKYGEDVLKYNVSTFSIMYRYSEEKDLIEVITLIHQRNIR